MAQLNSQKEKSPSLTTTVDFSDISSTIDFNNTFEICDLVAINPSKYTGSHWRRGRVTKKENDRYYVRYAVRKETYYSPQGYLIKIKKVADGEWLRMDNDADMVRIDEFDNQDTSWFNIVTIITDIPIEREWLDHQLHTMQG